jgi:hypothetical protein
LHPTGRCFMLEHTADAHAPGVSSSEHMGLHLQVCQPLRKSRHAQLQV